MTKFLKEPPAKILTCTFPEISGIFCQLNYGGPCNRNHGIKRKLQQKYKLFVGFYN